MTNIFFSLGAILAVISVSMGTFVARTATNFTTEQQLGWILLVVAAWKG